MNAPNQPKPVSEHVSLAVIEVEVGHIKEAVDRIEKAMRENVSTTSWQQRNQYVDQMFVEIRADIKDAETASAKAVAELWAEIKSKRVPWTSIAAFAIAGLLAFFEVLDRFGAPT